LERDLTFRDAQMKDAEGLAEIGRETFAETFGDLYPPGDLRQFLDDTYSISKMQADLGDPDVEVRIAFSGKKMAAYCKIGGDRNCLVVLRSVTYCSPKPQNPKYFLRYLKNDMDENNTEDNLAEWLRRCPAKAMGSPA